MANDCCKSCIGWRGIGILIGCITFVPILPLFIFVFFLNVLSLEGTSSDATEVITISAIANVCWFYGLAKYNPRCMLFPLCWFAFLAGYYVKESRRKFNSDEKVVVSLCGLMMYILALFSYDFVSKYASRTNNSRINQLSSNLTQMNHTRYSITATSPNEPLNVTCEVPMINSDDTKSLIMTVD